MARESKVTIIYNKIKQDINEGTYSPNEKLIESDLAAEYETSRNTIRQVLALLEKENLVTIEPHKGAKVTSLKLKDLVNLIEVRAEVEAYIVKKVTPTLLDEDIEKLGKIFSCMQNNLGNNDFKNHSELNNAFHELIYSKCDNKVAVELVRDLKNQVAKYNFKTILLPGRQDATLIEHEEILKAIREGDAEAAAQKTKNHIYSVRNTLVTYNEYI